MQIFISGVSSGIGKALCAHYLQEGHRVYGISRRKMRAQDFGLQSDVSFHHSQMDLTDHENIRPKLDELLGENAQLDLAILNAGVLGKIASIKLANLDELKQVMEVNLWSQKVLLDALIDTCSTLKTVVAISSGAGVRGSHGWGGYALSKAGLNMLIQLYADEFAQTQFYAFAPGLVDTSMQEQLSQVNAKEFPSLERLHKARGTDDMPTPEQFAPKFEQALAKLKTLPSGSFADIRRMFE